MRKYLLLVLALAASIEVTAWAQQHRVGLRIVRSTPGLLQISDLSCAGAFLTPYMEAGNHTVNYPLAFRYEGGDRYYFQYNGAGHVIHYAEPTLSSCATAFASMNQAGTAGFGDDWGTFPVNAVDDYIPGSNSTFAAGLDHDPVLDKLILSWYPAYVAVLTNNSFASATINDGGQSLSVDGCWGIPAYNTLMTGTGVKRIPSTFVSAYLPAGAAWMVGQGFAIGYAPGNSNGPSAVAIVPPSPNACASGTDYDVSSSTLLEVHDGNQVGPTCAEIGLGCSPPVPPTTPYPAKTQFTAYSQDMYAENWDPYGGHGWFGWDMYGKYDWYDDGVKHGIVLPMTSPSGWINTTIQASPSPTNGTFSITSTDTHDGYHINPNDLLWLQTCTVGVDTGCEEVNGNELSFIKVTTVDNGTGAITYTVLAPDPSSGSHTPVVGGKVYFGSYYAHGTPTSSRLTWRMQIYDPAQYAEVVATTRQPYAVEYAEEGALTSIVTQFGDPSNTTSGGVVSPFIENHAIASTMADPTAHQILFAVTNAKNIIGYTSSVVYVLNVSQSAPAPTSAPWSPVLPMVFGACYCMSWRRR